MMVPEVFDPRFAEGQILCTRARRRQQRKERPMNVRKLSAVNELGGRD